MKHLIGEQTYKVVDNPANRFNFFGLVNINQNLVDAFEYAPWGREYLFAGLYPEDVSRAVSVMQENGANIADFTGVVTFDDPETEDVYYYLTW